MHFVSIHQTASPEQGGAHWISLLLMYRPRKDGRLIGLVG